MNSYTLADISPGLTADFTLEVTAEKMALFYELTGDCSPIHMDEAYAQRRGYPGRVVYGMLGASLFSTLAGVYLPGEHCLLHGVECKFARPVFIGDVLTVSGTVTEVNETFREITVKAVITNQNGQKVTRGVIRAGVAGRMGCGGQRVLTAAREKPCAPIPKHKTEVLPCLFISSPARPATWALRSSTVCTGRATSSLPRARATFPTWL